jgi:hypothetical protein
MRHQACYPAYKQHRSIVMMTVMMLMMMKAVGSMVELA